MPSGGGMEMEMDREGLGSAFLRVELLRRQLLRPHFIELGLTVTGRAFLQLAAAVARQVDRRNMEMAPTKIVETHK